METFEIFESNNGGNKEVVIKNVQSGEYISILPKKGARLNSANLKSGENYFNLLKQLKTDELLSRDELFNNAKLFPFANRLKNGTYNFNNNEYKFEITYEEENNACHGMLYEEEFEIADKKIKRDSAEVSLFYQSDGNYPGYHDRSPVGGGHRRHSGRKGRFFQYRHQRSDSVHPGH